jgi:hypothetical protein
MSDAASYVTGQCINVDEGSSTLSHAAFHSGANATDMVASKITKDRISGQLRGDSRHASRTGCNPDAGPDQYRNRMSAFSLRPSFLPLMTVVVITGVFFRYVLNQFDHRVEDVNRDPQYTKHGGGHIWL